MRRLLLAFFCAFPLVGCALEVTCDPVTLDTAGNVITVPIRYVFSIDGVAAVTNALPSATLTGSQGTHVVTARAEAQSTITDADGTHTEWTPGVESEPATVTINVPAKAQKIKLRWRP